MRLPILAPLLIAAAPMLVPVPAAAQIFWQSPPVTGPALMPGEPAMGVTLPGATVAEERANWAWQMRAGLNVAKLQCKFDATLLTSDSYDGVYINHAVELAAAYDTLRKYFVRMNKAPKAAQGALDKYGTKTYSGFSTVSSQYGFCQTASRIGKKALFAPRGGFTIFTVERLREFRNSMVPGGEQLFRSTRINLPAVNLANECWDRRGRYISSCGYIY
ncbi:hypothetical protein [Sphingomonas sp. SUN039]|uniref:hypothetical protein n=1 Tax=Sphingomonas sp. SUN039 TaxID=2937787 RepID=UPI002164DDCD|nr:hypothetical protein [Sphingomonas sp. SUN039]UVO53986.1 hypothetical protein M0209_07575 [Sphingomonas sp. SUN039]